MNVSRDREAPRRSKLASLTRLVARHGWHSPFLLILRVVTALDFSQFKRRSMIRLLNHASVGRNVKIGRCVFISPGAHIHIGDDVYIGDGCVIEIDIGKDLGLQIGSGTWISHGAHIQAANGLKIGANVLIGEYVSIRDRSHRSDESAVPIRTSGDVVGKILIEDDVWIGRGCGVFANGKSLTIASGAIIGANSVVTKSVPKNVIRYDGRAVQTKPRLT